MDADRHVFCRAIYKGIEGSDWEELYHHHRKMSKAVRAKEPSESQKAKALWAMKSSQRQLGSILRLSPQRKHFGKETDKTGVVALGESF